MIAFKIKHKPTGLYYSNARWFLKNGKKYKTNLTKLGKVYCQKPSMVWLKNGYYHPDDLVSAQGNRRETNPDEFVVVFV